MKPQEKLDTCRLNKLPCTQPHPSRVRRLEDTEASSLGLSQTSPCMSLLFTGPDLYPLQSNCNPCPGPLPECLGNSIRRRFQGLLRLGQGAAGFLSLPKNGCRGNTVCHPQTHLSIEIKMFCYCEVFKQDVVLGAPAQAPPDLSHIA